MRRERRLSVWIAAVAMATGLIGYGGREVAEGADAKPGAWMGGAGFGFLADTPNGTAFALNLNAETFVAPKFSVGPLLQLGFTSVSSQVGLSGQAKFWVDVPQIAKGFKVTPQVGLGFVHNSVQDGDTSWLIPLGVGADYALTNKLNVTTTFLLNFTNLHTGRRVGANVMPGLTFGVRF